MVGIVFALDGTLVETNGLAARAFDDVLRAHAAYAELTISNAERRRVRERTFSGAATGAVATSDIAAALAALLQDRFPADRLEAAFRHAACALVTDVARPRPGARSALERIASLAIPAIVLTDEPGAVARRLADEVGFRGRVLATEDIGVRMHAAEAFTRAAEAVGLPAPWVRFVSARRAECDAARAAGMRAILVDPATVVDGDEMIETLESLEDLPSTLASDYTRSLLGLRHVLRDALAWRPGHFIPGVDRPT